MGTSLHRNDGLLNLRRVESKNLFKTSFLSSSASLLDIAAATKQNIASPARVLLNHRKRKRGFEDYCHGSFFFVAIGIIITTSHLWIHSGGNGLQIDIVQKKFRRNVASKQTCALVSSGRIDSHHADHPKWNITTSDDLILLYVLVSL